MNNFLLTRKVLYSTKIDFLCRKSLIKSNIQGYCWNSFSKLPSNWD